MRSSYGGITLLSLPGKVNLEVPERRVRLIVMSPTIQSTNVVFVLDVELWTSSTPSTGSLRVHESLPRKSIGVLDLDLGKDCVP